MNIAFRVSASTAIDELSRAGLSISHRWLGDSNGAGHIHTDSRKVEAGDVFIAYRGVVTDGHQYIRSAQGRAASLCILEDPDQVPESGNYVLVKSSRAAWALLYSAACDHPARKLHCVGVTGTNGKTSTTWMASHMLGRLGTPTLQIGTTGAYLDNTHFPTSHTTPDPDELYPLLVKGLQAGAKAMASEVSSHAIVQAKLFPVRFHASAFTSFSRDHLDFHPTMADYWAAKWRLFSELTDPSGHAIFCRNLRPPIPLEALAIDHLWTYGLGDPAGFPIVSPAPVRIRIHEQRFSGSDVVLEILGKTIQGTIPFFGRHAIENFVAALLCTHAVSGEILPAECWHEVPDIPGRLERVHHSRGPGVIVDYAHTPDALQKTLEVLRPLTRGKLVCVFGCGGDRDKGKRPEMGRIAAELADEVYVTSDNPRTEDPAAILHDIRQGIPQNVNANEILDREEAIAAALKNRNEHDLVCIAGKGHEDYQILGTKKVVFDDRLVAKSCLESYY